MSPRAADLAAGLLATLLAGLSLAAGVASAQGLQLRVGREPYYESVPIDLHAHATDLEKEPDPRCEAEPPAEGTLTLRGIVPNIASRVQVINGRVFREEDVSFTCQYQFTAERAGTYAVGPFRMLQGNEVRESERITLRVRKVPVDERVKVRIVIPDEPVFLGQHVPVEVQWWLDTDLRDKISAYSLRSRLFEQQETFRFIDDPPPKRGQQNLTLTLPDGTQDLGATITQRRQGSREYLVVASQRTLVPLRSGEFDLGTATVQVDEIVEWQRNLFGGRSAGRTRKVLGRDEPRRLVVKAPPQAGRPASYAGAVGRGFSLEVTADRSVVQLGDPITLELTISGDGNLESAGLPALAGPGGLDPAQFRAPSEDVSGRVNGDTKTFRVGVRVLDDAVREIPALDYSWFDPDTMSYQTTRSRPIALSVRPAEVISARDVVTGAAEPGAAEPERPAAPSPQEGGPATRRGSIRMTGADLSLVRDESLLLESQQGSDPLRLGLYAAGVLLIAGAVWQRRRSNVSPELVARRQSLLAQRKRIAAARGLPRREALSEMVAALRELASLAPEVRSEALDAFVRECETVLYDPRSGADSPVEAERVARAEALLDAAAEEIG